MDRDTMSDPYPAEYEANGRSSGPLSRHRHFPAPGAMNAGMSSPRRVVTLLASGTEIVCALGCGERLVGRSHECDYPPEVRSLPVCTAALIDATQSSAAIDRQVKTAARDALALYHVDREVLKALQPDVIVTQTQCEVCAVSLRDVERAVCSWLGACPRLVSLAPNALADVWGSIEQVAEALGVPERGEELIGRLRGRMAAVAEKARALPGRPTVACVEWVEPLMASGNWMPELVEMAGGVSLFGEAGKHAPWMTWEQLAERDPDVWMGLDAEAVTAAAYGLRYVELMTGRDIDPTRPLPYWLREWTTR